MTVRNRDANIRYEVLRLLKSKPPSIRQRTIKIITLLIAATIYFGIYINYHQYRFAPPRIPTVPFGSVFFFFYCIAPYWLGAFSLVALVSTSIWIVLLESVLLLGSDLYLLTLYCFEAGGGHPGAGFGLGKMFQMFAYIFVYIVVIWYVTETRKRKT